MAGPVSVSLAGATITATIDGQALQIMIQDQVAQASQRSKVVLQNGLQNASF